MIHQINYVISKKKKDEERCIFVYSHVEIINLVVNVIDSDSDNDFDFWARRAAPRLTFGDQADLYNINACDLYQNGLGDTKS